LFYGGFMSVRTRFAPSPTGHLHVGGARTALYNWLYAQATGGQFILRIEDTDLERSTQEAMEKQLQDLKWLGLNWDEGPRVDGDYGPYQQSLRKEIYQKYAEELLNEGKAYYCFCSDEELQTQRDLAIKEGRNPHYNGKCRSVSREEAKKRIEAGESAVVRFWKKTEKEYVLNDLIRGDVRFGPDMIGDFVILRSNGMPVYNFCCAIDDASMKITHVLRAEEHLNNTLRQMMIYEAFGWELPTFGHVSLILGEDKQKLSKRHGATSCNEYREKGFLASAMINFLALLGWSSPKGDEIMTTQELISQFDLDRFTPSAAVFDEKKLRWVNQNHLRKLSDKEFWAELLPILERENVDAPSSDQWRALAASVLKERVEILSDAIELLRPLSDESFAIDEKGAETLSWDESKPVINKWQEILSAMNAEYLTEQDFLDAQNKVKEECAVKGKFLFMPIRVAVIGKPHGVDLQSLVPLLPRASLIERADKCLQHMGK
jgi:nondiscriminating glutamyl-tRNA synthetase